MTILSWILRKKGGKHEVVTSRVALIQAGVKARLVMTRAVHQPTEAPVGGGGKDVSKVKG